MDKGEEEAAEELRKYPDAKFQTLLERH